MVLAVSALTLIDTFCSCETWWTPSGASDAP